MMRFTREILLFMAIAGFFEYAAPLMTAFWVAAHIDAGLLTLIMATTPMFTVALAAALGTEPLTRRIVLACAVGLAAMALIVVPQDALPSREMLPWCLVGFAVPIFYAMRQHLRCAQLATRSGYHAGRLRWRAGRGAHADAVLGEAAARRNAGGKSGERLLGLAALIVTVVLEMMLYMYSAAARGCRVHVVLELRDDRVRIRRGRAAFRRTAKRCGCGRAWRCSR